MNPVELLGSGVFIHDNVKIGRNVKIGHCSCIGYGDPEDGEIVIGDNVIIGAFTVVHFGAVILDAVEIEHHCVIGIESEIGANTRILSGKQISYKAKIGENCIIGGHVVDRTIIEDNVSYFGEIAHAYRNPSLDWDETEEPSPIIYKGSVVGVNALIIGNRRIGPCAYIGAGEIVKTDVGKGLALFRGQMKPVDNYRGFINTRCHE